MIKLKYICTGCLGNASLIRYVRNHYSKRIKECPLCRSKNKYAIDYETLGYYMDSCIFHNYSSLEEMDGVDYDSESNSFYYSDTYSEVELTSIHNILNDNDFFSKNIEYDIRDEIIEEIFESICDGKNIYNYLTETGWVHATSNELFFSWDSFNYLIQNNNRFFDFGHRHRLSYLDRIFCLLLEFEEEIAPNTVLYRVRNDSSLCPDILDNFDTALKEISPPPCKFTKSYRMSPQGISYTYLSTDIKTCLKECKSHIHDTTLIGKFTISKPLKILNLEIKDYPYYDLFSGRMNREKENIDYFIERYSSEISKPVSTEHENEYLSTQVIAEYIRLQGYDGIAYSSSKTSATNYVFFYGPDYYRFPDTKPKGCNYYIDSVTKFTDILTLTGCALCTITNSRSCNYDIVKSILDF